MDSSLLALIMCAAVSLAALFAMCGLPMAGFNPLATLIVWLNLRLAEIEADQRAKSRAIHQQNAAQGGDNE